MFRRLEGRETNLESDGVTLGIRETQGLGHLGGKGPAETKLRGVEFDSHDEERQIPCAMQWIREGAGVAGAVLAGRVRKLGSPEAACHAS